MAKHEVTVKEYKDAKAFEKDAQKMTRDGWQIQEQSQGSTQKNSVRSGLKKMMGGGASDATGTITATWARGDEHEMKPCPRCREQVLLSANVCRYCGHQFA